VTPLTLRTRLTLFHTAILALLVTALSLAYYRILSLQLDTDATSDLREITAGLHGYLHIEDGQPLLIYDRTDPDQVAFVEAASRYYQVFDATTGELLAQSTAMQPLGLHYTPVEVASFRDRPRTIDVVTDHGRLRLSNSLLTPGPGDVYLLQVGVSLESVDSALDRFFRLLLWSVPASVVLVLVIGRMMAARSLVPLADLARRMSAITVADLRQRLPVRGVGDELDNVAEAFNDTIARLEHAIGEMKQFSAAIAHELRTPLAALRGETELALLRASSPGDYHRALESQLEEFDKLTRLITQLLTLARAEAGEIPLAGERVDLAALAASVVDELEPVAQARDIQLTCDRIEPAVAHGDAGWLERLILNLLDNALKFTGPGGRVGVSVWPDGARAVVQVRDTGVGMSADALPRIFERFYRADPARSSSSEGAGLGLSLVKWIVEHHGGTIDVTSQPDEGTTVTVHLPLVSANPR
jgi:heavy metal sensor kinase